jgi:hypothetical protein
MSNAIACAATRVCVGAIAHYSVQWPEFLLAAVPLFEAQNFVAVGF